MRRRCPRPFSCLGWSAALLGVLSLLSGGPTRAQNGAPPSRCRIDVAAKCPGVALSGAALNGQYMAMMDLSGADLAGADLRSTDLWKTNFAGAALSHADLADSFLTGADLRGADLSGADLRRAFIFGAFTDGARFDGALLEGARWITGAICGPGSVGKCRPLPPDAAVSSQMVFGPPGGVYPGAAPPTIAAAKLGDTLHAAGASQPTPVSAVARQSPQGTVRILQIRYAGPRGTAKQILPPDPNKARRTDGASILGGDLRLHGPAVLHVSVVANAYAAQNNEVVLALFQAGRSTPIDLIHHPVKGKERVVLELTADVPVAGPSSTSFDVRIGPARPGFITIVGGAAAAAANVPQPSLTVTESE